MKKILIIAVAFFYFGIISAQKKPSSADLNKMMQNAMKQKGMSKEEQKQMKEMMDMAGSLSFADMPFSNYPTFTDNAYLLPKKNNTKITAIEKRLQTDEDVKAKSNFIYNRIMAKAPAEEKDIINKTLAKLSGADDVESVAVASLLKGHILAALGLAAHAVQINSASAVYQNNLAAILTQSGYPEQAIPILEKLEKQFPKNSSILTNSGYAWFYLGDKDKSKKYMNMALAVNPAQPEANVCAGIIDEINGDPINSANELEHGFENSLDQFSADLIKNNNGKDATGELTFDKIKDKITIYEYIKKDWIESLPKYSYSCLEDNVNNDEELRMGYSDMIQELYKYLKIWEDTIANAEKNLDTKMNNAPTTEKLKYASKKSDLLNQQFLANAGIILDIIKKHVAELGRQWREETFAELKQELIEHQTVGPPKPKDGEDDCEVRAKYECDFIPGYDDKYRTLAVKKLEEFRLALNAELTWSWYVNIFDTENQMVAHQFTDNFKPYVELLNDVAQDYVLGQYCDHEKNFSPKAIPTERPQLPQFECPIVVSIPSGMNFTQLAGARGSGNNSAVDIKPSTTNPVPNVQIGMGLDKNTPSEPGNKNTPYVQTSNGNAQAMNIQNTDDDELAPLANIVSSKDAGTVLDKEGIELAPITKTTPKPESNATVTDKEGYDLASLADITPNIKDEPMTEEEINDVADAFRDFSKNKALKKMLHDLMADCNGLNKYNPQDLKDKINKEARRFKSEYEKKLGDAMQNITDMLEAKDKVTEEQSKKLNDTQSNIEKTINKIHNSDISQVGNDGIVPTIVNGMQADVQSGKGLFDK